MSAMLIARAHVDSGDTVVRCAKEYGRGIKQITQTTAHLFLMDSGGHATAVVICCKRRRGALPALSRLRCAHVSFSSKLFWRHAGAAVLKSRVPGLRRHRYCAAAMRSRW